MGAETKPNIAEITVMDDQVRLVLEVYIGDLDLFDDLVPDKWLSDGADSRPTFDARMRHFADETFQFVTEEGKNLLARRC